MTYITKLIMVLLKHPECIFSFKSYCWVLDSKQIHLIRSNYKYFDIAGHNFLWRCIYMKCTCHLQTHWFLNVNILASRQFCALKFYTYIPQTTGDNFRPKLMLCDVFLFIPNLTLPLDLDCDSAEVKQEHLKRTDWTYSNRSSCKVHYNDVIMSAMASQITSLSIAYSIVYSGTDHRRHQNSA